MDPSIRWLTCALTEVPKDDAWLSPTERERQTRLTVDKRRNDWRLGRFTAKRALERAGLNAPLQMISILPAQGRRSGDHPGRRAADRVHLALPPGGHRSLRAL